MKSAHGRAIFAAAVFALSSYANARDQSFTGYSRDVRSGALLYVESHYVANEGRSDETRVVLYLCSAGGAAFGRKELTYGSTRQEPRFVFRDARSGYEEGLRRTPAGLQVFQRDNQRSKMRQAAVPANIVIVSDAGFDEFVRLHWNDLEAGKAVKFPFLIPSRLDYLNFRVVKHGEVVIEGEPASVIRLNLSGFLGWFLPYIDVSYRKNDRVLMRYKGLSNVRDVEGNNHTVQIDFPTRERRTTVVDLAAVRAQQLVSRCP